MKRNNWILWSIALQMIIIMSVVMIFQHNKTVGPSGESTRGTTLSVWVYSQGLESALNEFHQINPDIDLNVRYFRSSDQLFTELMAAISANDAPQLAEIKSFYGIAQLVDTKAVLPVDEVTFPQWKKLQPSFTEPFHYEKQYWAVPFGGGIPLIYYREELLRNVHNGTFRNWDEVVKAAIETNRGDNDVYGHWGIGIDMEVPWYLEGLNVKAGNSESNEFGKFDSAESMWSAWVHSLKIMKPLTHRRAPSDFINGKIGLFISSSEQISIIERYIGGKFQYNAQSLPGADQQGVVPSIDSLVVLKSTEDKVKAANSFMAYMLDSKTQEALWRNVGVIPSQIDVWQKLQLEETWTPVQKLILDAVRLFVEKKPSKEDYARWVQTQSKLEQLEQESSALLRFQANNTEAELIH